MLPNVKMWGITKEEIASDHNVIKFSISLDKPSTQKKTLCRTKTQNKVTPTK